MVRNLAPGVNGTLPAVTLFWRGPAGFWNFTDPSLHYSLLLQPMRCSDIPARSSPLVLPLKFNACFPPCRPAGVMGLFLVLLVAGCASKEGVVVHTFEKEPGNWSELAAGRDSAGASAGVRVASHSLRVNGTHVLLEPTRFENFRGMVDVAVAGGAPKGFAGVFLRREGDDRFYCFAIRPWGAGEYRYYAAGDPLRPAGGSGWQLASRNTPAGYVRLGFEYAGGKIRFRMDDEEFIPSFESILSRAEDSGPWQLGIFSMGLNTRWNNFIVSNDNSGAGLSGLADWGGIEAAVNLEREFVDGTKAFISNPDRSSIFTLAAALSGAQKIYGQNGAGSDSRKLSARAAGLLEPMKLAARRLGEEELLVRCFAMGAASVTDRRRILGAEGEDFSARAREAEARGGHAEAAVYYAAALSLQEDSGLAGKLEAARGKVPIPSYSFEMDEEKVKNRVVAQSRFRAAVQADFGGLPRKENADLVIRVKINRSSASKDVETATRQVPVIVGGVGMSSAEREELIRLQRELPEFLVDAKARAEIRRVSIQLSGRTESQGALDTYTIAGKKYELHIDDGKRALKDQGRLNVLQEKWDGLKSQLNYEQLEAERTTVSINFSADVDLLYKGKSLVAGEKINAYRGIVLWRHEAVSAKGIEASTPSNTDIKQAAEAVRRRVLGQFAGLISRAKLLARLEKADRLALLLRLARSSGNSRDELNLRWYLEKEFGFKEVLCDEVSRRLLNLARR